MRKTALACTALLLAAGLAIPSAQAQVCLDFLLFSDSLELTIEGDWITGLWINADGQGGIFPVTGVIREGLPNPCHPNDPGRVGVACVPEFGCDLFGDDWYFVFNELNGIVALGNSVDGIIPPPGACGFDISYQVLMGPCPPLLAPKPGESAISSAQAVR